MPFQMLATDATVKLAITSEMLEPITTTLVENLGVLLPVGISKTESTKTLS